MLSTMVSVPIIPVTSFVIILLSFTRKPNDLINFKFDFAGGYLFLQQAFNKTGKTNRRRNFIKTLIKFFKNKIFL
jgi:hypothetical protein